MAEDDFEYEYGDEYAGEYRDDYEDEPADEPGAAAGSAETPFVVEATRLIGVVQDWARQTFPAPPSGHGGPECQWCPLCQFAAVLRGERPEVTERVAEAGTALMSAMKAFVEVAANSGAAAGFGPGAPGANREPGDRPRPGPAPRVQHIDLGPTSDTA